MRPFKTLRLIWTFYQSFIMASAVINISGLIIFWNVGYRSFTGLFWLKIITIGLTYYFINEYKSKEYYYFQNLGLSKKLLWSVIAPFDFLVFILLIPAIHQLK